MKERAVKQAKRFAIRGMEFDSAEFRKRMEDKRPIDFVTGRHVNLGKYIDVIRNERQRFLYVKVQRRTTREQREALVTTLKRRIPSIEYLKISRLFRKVWTRTDIKSYRGVLKYITKAFKDSPFVVLKFEW